MRYLPEPTLPTGSSDRIGILLINLGTPAAPTTQAVRPYLKQFLSDPRVVEIPRLAWWPILNLLILNTRPKQSAAKYAAIWRKDGSALAIYTQAQAKLLQGSLARPEIKVEWAMRYGEPSVASKLAVLKLAGCSRVLVLPMYPQYAASSTGSAMDAVAQALLQQRNPPELRFIKQFHDHPLYIQTLASRVREHWAKQGRGEHLLLSFHGLPQFSVERGDPYYQQCLHTGALLAQALSLAKDEFTLSFQSRFGRTQWLKPYTSEILDELGQRKLAKLDVLCPGFTADCLETLEEIAIEGRTLFQQAGGSELRYIPALNDGADWIKALAQIVQPHLWD